MWQILNIFKSNNAKNNISCIVGVSISVLCLFLLVSNTLQKKSLIKINAEKAVLEQTLAQQQATYEQLLQQMQRLNALNKANELKLNALNEQAQERENNANDILQDNENWADEPLPDGISELFNGSH